MWSLAVSKGEIHRRTSKVAFHIVLKSYNQIAKDMQQNFLLNVTGKVRSKVREFWRFDFLLDLSPSKKSNLGRNEWNGRKRKQADLELATLTLTHIPKMIKEETTGAIRKEG